MIERKFVEEGIKEAKLRDFLAKQLEKAGFTDMKIQKTPLTTRVVVTAERPGLVIGRRGANIRDLTEQIKEDFSFNNPQIEVEQLEDSRLDPRALARRIVRNLEKGTKAKRVLYRTLSDVLSAHAIGVEIILEGKIVGKGGRARKERATAGYMKKAGEPKRLVREAKDTAYLKSGAIGITVRVVPPNTAFSDKLKVEDYIRLRTQTQEIEATVVPQQSTEKPQEKTGQKTPEAEQQKKQPEAPTEKPETPKTEKTAAEKKEKPKTLAKEDKKTAKKAVEKTEPKKPAAKKTTKAEKKQPKKPSAKKDDKKTPKKNEKKVK